MDHRIVSGLGLGLYNRNRDLLVPGIVTLMRPRILLQQKSIIIKAHAMLRNFGCVLS